MRDRVGHAHAREFLWRQLPGWDGVIDFLDLAAVERRLFNREERHFRPSLKERPRHLSRIGHEAAHLYLSEYHKNQEVQNESGSRQAPQVPRFEDGYYGPQDSGILARTQA